MRTLALAVVALAAAGSAVGQEADFRPPAPRPVVEPSASAKPVPMNEAELSGLNGRQGSSSTILSDQDLTAVNRGNTITATTVGSGPITLGPGAFNGFAGVGNFVINSGHNNNLQGALTINIIASQ